MIMLGIETSWERGGVTVSEEGQVVARETLDKPRSHGEKLAVLVNRALRRANGSPGDLDLIAVNRGPGSYTGLRVGVTFAKTLAYARDIDLVPVHAMEVIAHDVPVRAGRLVIVINAEWNEVYTVTYRAREDEWVREGRIKTKQPGTVCEELEEDTLIVGNGLEVFSDTFSGMEADRGEETCWYPSSRNVVSVGRKRFEEEGGSDPFGLEPLYLRPTQADVDPDS